MTNFPPFKTLDLDEETFDFLVENCEANLIFGLRALSEVHSPDLMAQLVANIESFKKLRLLLQKAK